MSIFFKKIGNYFKTVVLPIFTGIQWLDISVSTYVRWILAALVSVNTIITAIGINPINISENDAYLIVSLILNVVVLIINTYKNNSTSKEAIITDSILRALKAATISDEDTAIGKLQDILKELNGEDYISSEHTNQDEIETQKDTTDIDEE